MRSARTPRAALLGLLLAGTIGLLPAAAFARTCTEIDAEARGVQEAGDLDRLIALYTEAHEEGTGCTQAFLAGFGNDVALGHIDRFFAGLDRDGDTLEAKRAHRPILKAAEDYGRPWQLLVTLAQVDYELGEEDSAANLYQQAVVAMAQTDRAVDDSPAKENLPSATEFKGIYEKMTQAALLAEDFSPPAASRGEKVDGLFIESYRGFVPAAVPIPIEFQTASTRPTAKGDKALKHLAEYLSTSGLSSITLVGHTDPRGGPTFNQKLSLDRANFVAKFLKDNGYAGSVRTEGKGETVPFSPKPSDIATDQAKSFQLDRRVELIR